MRHVPFVSLVVIVMSSGASTAGPVFTQKGGIAAPGFNPAYSIDANGNAVLNSLSASTMIGTTPLSTVVAEANGALQMGGGDVSQTLSRATGSPLSRTQSDRAADTVNVMDFGARGDDATDDTAAINQALAFARGKVSGTNGPFVGTNGPYAHLVFPSGHRFRINSALNFTGFSGNGFDVDMMGASIDCHAKGQICIDATGDNEMRFHSVRVVGDPNDMPRIGMQIGRTDTLNTSADNNTFENLTIIGQFSFTAFYNFAAETTTFIHPEFWNFSGRPGSYALVQDDYDHFNMTSTFQTITATVDKPSSFNENVFVGADVRGGVGQTVPMWLGGTSRHSFIRSYAAGGGGACAPTCYGVVLFNEGGVYNQMLHMDTHIETAGLTDIFLIAGDPQQAIYGIDYIDQGPEASNSMFKLDSNVTYVELRAADFNIGGYYPTAKLLDAPSAWRIAGYYSSGSAAGFNATTWQGPIVVGSNEFQGNYGTGPLQTEVPDSTTRGGNLRGANAVDWQSARIDPTQVGSGLFSTIGGGQNNLASGAYSIIPGGVQNSVTSQFGIAMGYGNNVSGAGATAIGTGNAALAASSLSAGTGAGDNGNNGTFAWAKGVFSSPGDATAGLHVLRGSGSGTSPIRLTVDAAAAAASTCLAPPANASFALSVTLEARDTTTSGSDYVWKMPAGLLTRDTSVASTAIVLGQATSVSRGTVTGAAVGAAADTTNGCLALSFTPPSGNTTDVWHAVARVETVEVR
jgi:hypothetical protein